MARRGGHVSGIGLALAMLPALLPAAPAKDTSTTSVVEMAPMVSTGSRSAGSNDASAMPVGVISRGDIGRTGAVRLSDVLAEQAGLTIVHERGTGVQMQGLDPDYTLILVDGEPMIGRIAGTLDLDRIYVSGIEQIEIVKGPSSSLYGSDALGGVINLVTRAPKKPFAASARVRAGQDDAWVTGATVETRKDGYGLSLNADHSRSEGYDMTPGTRERTAPAYRTFTLQPKLTADAGPATLTIAPRMLWQQQWNETWYVADGDSVPATTRTALDDHGLSATLETPLGERVDLTVKGHTAMFRTNTTSRFDVPGSATHDSTVSDARFDQRIHKMEAYASGTAWGKHELLAGGGLSWETVRADRVTGGSHVAPGGFAFVQEEWKPSPDWTLQLSGRIDAHGDYPTHFSPRMAARTRVFPWLTLRASVGKGFKAPDFQQLYMDFTNPTVGYSVFGSSGVSEAVDQLESAGLIAERLLPLNGHELRPEKSWAFNAGAEAKAGPLTASASVFRNNVHDLIESAAVARRTNGQHVYTYFNLNSIHTQGVETELSLRLMPGLSVGGGYQFLIARDDDVVDRIGKDSILKIGSTGVLRPVQMVEYGGLFNRSRHSGTVRATWERDAWTVAARGTLRGRYGYADRNGNGILDDDSEYASGYTLWNLTVTRRVGRYAEFQVTADNLFDEKRHLVPLPGRRLYAGLQVRTP